MAYPNQDQKHPAWRGQSEGGGRNGLYFTAAIACILIGGTLAYVALSDEPVDGGFVDDPAEDARPVGAGTIPDGEADELNEGLGNETTTEDFIAPGAPTDGFANPPLEAPDGDPSTVPSIDQLDPGPAIDDEVLERMAPGTQGAQPEG